MSLSNPTITTTPPLALADVTVLRALLLAGAVAAAAGAAWIGGIAPPFGPDHQLAVLLRGMAAIKAGIVLASAAAVWWRLGRTLSRRVAAAYLAGVWLAVAATVLIAQLAFIGAAAFAFHAGELALLATAWVDGRFSLRFRRSCR